MSRAYSLAMLLGYKIMGIEIGAGFAIRAGPCIVFVDF